MSPQITRNGTFDLIAEASRATAEILRNGSALETPSSKLRVAARAWQLAAEKTSGLSPERLIECVDRASKEPGCVLSDGDQAEVKRAASMAYVQTLSRTLEQTLV